MMIRIMGKELEGVTRYETYKSGGVKECNLKKRNSIVTSYGTLIPKYTEPFGIDERLLKNRSSISFYENGAMKAIALDKQTEILTSLGSYPCELATFYEDGKLHRVFPLNGLINGYWTEEDEGALAETYSFDWPFGKFKAKIISLRFYPSGQLRALTLWPGEKIVLQTPVGKMSIRNGFSLYEDGRLQSVEPEEPVYLVSQIGMLQSFDDDALGIHADQNSIKFSPHGDLIGFKSSTHGVIVKDEAGNAIKIGPRVVPSYVDISENVIRPIQVSILQELVIIDNGIKHQFELERYKFATYKYDSPLMAGCSNCSSCNACG
jgi:hypothetical protein